MTCPGAEELVRQTAGMLSLEEEQALREHVRGCPRCSSLLTELADTKRAIAAEPGEFGEPSFSAGVMARIAREESAPSRTQRRWVAGLSVPAFAAAAAALLLVVRAAPDAGFQSRGDQAERLNRWVSLKVFRATADGNVPVGSTVRPDDALVFAYTNDPEHRFGYLMVLGVDGRGQVFWYYPAHLSAEESPMSIAAAPGSGLHPLPDQISHAIEPGPLRLFALFTAQPLDVLSVEAIVARGLAMAGSLERLERLSLDGAGQSSVLLQVEGER